MEQIQEQQPQEQQTEQTLTIRDYVDMAIIFGCLPALILNVLFWAIATAFGNVPVLSSVLALLITILLALVGLILIVHYVDMMVANIRLYNERSNESLYGDDGPFLRMLGGGAVWIFCAIWGLPTVGTESRNRNIAQKGQVRLNDPHTE